MLSMGIVHGRRCGAVTICANIILNMLGMLGIRTRHLKGAALACWILAVGTGVTALLQYEMQPGQGSSVTSHWPSASRISRDGSRPLLVMFAHPRCPCTRASLEELARLMARCEGLLAAHVLFVKPAGSGPAWERTDLWESASRIPGVEVVADVGGQEQKLFNTDTSGHVVVYDAAGQLAFSGGLTSARGHAGESIGKNAITQLVEQGQASRKASLVFGCPLCRP